MILTLCGSARFEPYWHEANKQLGLAGHICFSLMTFPSIEGSHEWYSAEQKQMLDLAHLSKIQASDGVVMLNIEDYLGESSTRELIWARMQKKKVFWTEFSSRWDIETDEGAGTLTRTSYRWERWESLFKAVAGPGAGQGAGPGSDQARVPPRCL